MEVNYNDQKILCFCGSGLGTSFVMEMNAKKAGGKVIGLTNMVAMKEIQSKLKEVFDEENA